MIRSRDIPTPLVALTGGIGSGKSTALAIFASLGAAVLDCDQLVHRLLESDDVRRRVAETLDMEVIPYGKEGRGLVADQVFSDEDRLERLEAVLHPLVRAEIEAWRKSDVVTAAPLAVVEIQMLFEAAMDDIFDVLVLVTAAAETRRERVSSKLAEKDFNRRSGQQLPDVDKRARCDLTYDNVGDLAGLEAFVRETFDSLSRTTA